MNPQSSKEYLAIAQRQREDYESGKTKMLRLCNCSGPYYPNLEKQDSDSIQNADTRSLLFNIFEKSMKDYV
jgi:hypothetical protein